jgi:hypothetical protein
MALLFLSVYIVVTRFGEKVCISIKIVSGVEQGGIPDTILILQRHIYPIPLLASPLKGEGLEKLP